MAEQNYIIAPNGSGSVNIGEDVFLRLVAVTVEEMDAVAGLSSAYSPELAEHLGKKALPKGVALTTNEDGSITLDIILTMRFGHNVARTAESVQEQVSAAVEAMTGIKCKVNVHVTGISFEKAEMK